MCVVNLEEKRRERRSEKRSRPVSANIRGGAGGAFKSIGVISADIVRQLRR